MIRSLGVYYLLFFTIATTATRTLYSSIQYDQIVSKSKAIKFLDETHVFFAARSSLGLGWNNTPTTADQLT